MHILVSNDDGYHARGILAMAQALREIATVTVVAPDRNRSGASHSLTLDAPLRVRRVGPEAYCVTGTPTDCVHLAITGLLEKEPDMVISGINHGANLGDDVLYSGTVAAAMEGRFLGLPAIAMSLDSERCLDFSAAAKVACDIVGRLARNPLPADTILNVNVPDRPYAELAGMQATRLGHRHKAEPIIKQSDPRGHPIYWVGPAGPGQDSGPGTDFSAIKDGYVALTPLRVDLTRYDAIDLVAGWLDQ